MSKRTPGLERRERDFWPTPAEAVKPLIPHLRDVSCFDEPMCGDGAIIDALREVVACISASDIEPKVEKWSARKIDVFDLNSCLADCFITNPPWPHPYKRGEPTLGFIRHLSAIAPTWMILPSDFMFNAYAAEVMDYCPKVVAVGRVSWMHNGKGGMDNAAWYLFDQLHRGRAQFFPRAA